MHILENLRKTTITKNVAIPRVIILLLLSGACAVKLERMDRALTTIQNEIYHSFSWTYILLVSFFLIFLFVLAFSKIGTIRLGVDNSATQYGFVSWIANAIVSSGKLEQKLMALLSQLQGADERLTDYTRWEQTGKDISSEMAALCPQVSSVGISKMLSTRTDTTISTSVVCVLVTLKHKATLPANDEKKMRLWLLGRCKVDCLQLVVRR